MAGWMINCKEYASLVSRSLDRSMSFWEKVSMKMHQVLCPPCKHIKQQFDAIRKACRFAPEGADSDAHRLSDQVCKHIKIALHKAAKEKDV